MEEVTQPRTTYRYYDPSTITIKDIHYLRRQVHTQFKNKLEFLHAVPAKKTMEDAEAIGTTLYYSDEPCPYHNRHSAVIKTKYGWSHACCVNAFNKNNEEQLHQLPHSYVMPIREEVEAEYACRIYELDQMYRAKATAKTIANNASKERVAARKAEERKALAAVAAASVLSFSRLSEDLGDPDEADDLEEEGLMYA